MPSGNGSGPRDAAPCSIVARARVRRPPDPGSAVTVVSAGMKAPHAVRQETRVVGPKRNREEAPVQEYEAPAVRDRRKVRVEVPAVGDDGRDAIRVDRDRPQS